MASSFTRLLDHTLRHATVGRTPLDECSALLQRPLPDNRQHTHAPCGITTHDSSRWAAVDLRLSPRGPWDRLSTIDNK
jgi:hypothetical protein